MTETANFQVVNDTTDVMKNPPGQPYDGPVDGLDWQYVTLSCDNLEISATSPNVFIHSGRGNDQIDVSGVNGNNVLDGSSGSNVLIGGTGNDTFFLDDRNPGSNIFGTIQNFHSGDNIAVWGITPGDFGLHYGDGQDANGVDGLTISLSASGKPHVKLILDGFTADDLDNGRVTLTPGRTPDLPDLPGSPYLLIHAV